MKNKLKALFITLMVLVGVSTFAGQTPAHASYANSAGCTGTAGNWYIHGPYDHDHNGAMWSWATVVPTSTTAPTQDFIIGASPNDCNAGSGFRIDAVAVEAYLNSVWVQVAVNYEGWRTLGMWGDTVYANSGGCASGHLYRTAFGTGGWPTTKYYTTAYIPC